MEMHKLCAERGSGFIVKQVNGEFAFRGDSLLAYHTSIQKLIKIFSTIRFDHVLPVHNKNTDALGALSSKLNVPDETVDVKMTNRTLGIVQQL